MGRSLFRPGHQAVRTHTRGERRGHARTSQGPAQPPKTGPKWALGSSRSLLPPVQGVLGTWWSSPGKGGRSSLTPPALCSPQGRGLHPLRDGHREAPLPRLHSQGRAAPHLPPPRSVACRTPALATRGRQHSAQPRRAKDLAASRPISTRQEPRGLGRPWLPPPVSALAPHYALSILLVLPGTPTEETWPGVTALPEFRAYSFPRYLPQPLLSHAPR